MGLLDGILGQIMGGGQNAIENTVLTGLAEKVGLSPEMAQTAIAALAQFHPQPGDTVQAAADHTGLSPDVLQQIVGHLGGESGLASIASSLLGGAQGAGAPPTPAA